MNITASPSYDTSGFISAAHLVEVPWDNSYSFDNANLDALYGAVFASYDDFRICVNVNEYHRHIPRSLRCLAEAFDQLFHYEGVLLSSQECRVQDDHRARHEQILDKLWLAFAISGRGVVNECEITSIFLDWILVHVSSLDRAYTNSLT